MRPERFAAASMLVLVLVGCDWPARKGAAKSVRSAPPAGVKCSVPREAQVKPCPKPDVPAWMLADLPNEAPTAPSLAALRDANNARARTLDYANCRSRAIRRHLAGEVVPASVCGKP